VSFLKGHSKIIAGLRDGKSQAPLAVAVKITQIEY